MGAVAVAALIACGMLWQRLGNIQEQLARQSGASIRSLQNSFRQHLSATPNAYILQMRLSRVHTELLTGSGDESIEKIASRWGFGHMGYFAARYRAQYGQAPSDTRKSRTDLE